MSVTMLKKRRALGLSQADLAKRARLSRQTVVVIEGGSCPSLASAMRIARALRTPLSVLFPEHDADVGDEDACRTREDLHPCLAVDHVHANGRLRILRDRLDELRHEDLILIRRGQDITLAHGEEILIVCEDADGHVAMDSDGARRLVRMLIPAMDRAVSDPDTRLITRQNDLLNAIGRMIAGRIGDGLGGTTELMVEAPLPWRPTPIVRTDMRSGVGMWNDPVPEYAELVPKLPSIVQFSTTDGRIAARGWGRRVILLGDMPDVVETLRLCIHVQDEAAALMDAAGRVRHRGGGSMFDLIP